MTDKVLLTPEEAAQALGIGRAYLFSLLSSGDLVSIKVGRLRRIPATEVDRFVAKRLVSPDVEQAGS